MASQRLPSIRPKSTLPRPIHSTPIIHPSTHSSVTNHSRLVSECRLIVARRHARMILAGARSYSDEVYALEECHSFSAPVSPSIAFSLNLASSSSYREKHAFVLHLEKQIINKYPAINRGFHVVRKFP